VLLALLVAVLVAGAFAQAQHPQQQPPPGQFQPTPGQAGKDVIWLPTSQALVDRMLDLGKVTAQDTVFDLGSGDGRTVITAAKRGARAYGIEYNPDMVELSKRAAADAGVSEKATFEKADLFETDFSKATVITMFLLPDINLRLRPKILDLKPGTRIVSNSFTMGEWTADDTVTVDEDCTTYCTAYLWIVPAKTAGTWQSAQGELTLGQEFQMVTGTLKNGAASTPIDGGKLLGDQISFAVGGAQYKGRVNGSTIDGTVASNGKTENWSATRK
jgi:SAM-dependent methyltransferase